MFFGQRAVHIGLQHFGVAQDGIDGCAQIVADVRQQLRLKAQGFDRLITGHGQFLSGALAIGHVKRQPDQADHASGVIFHRDLFGRQHDGVRTAADRFFAQFTDFAALHDKCIVCLVTFGAFGRIEIAIGLAGDRFTRAMHGVTEALIRRHIVTLGIFEEGIGGQAVQQCGGFPFALA